MKRINKFLAQVGAWIAGLKLLKHVKTVLAALWAKIAKGAKSTPFRLLLSCMIGITLFITSGNYYGSIGTGVFLFILLTSKDIFLDIICIGSLSSSITFEINRDVLAATLIGFSASIIMYALVLFCKFLAEKNLLFTFLKQNEWRVIETGDGMLKEYIGIAKRWSSEKGSVQDPEKKSDTATLKTYGCDPVTGMITEMKTTPTMIIMMYLTQRIGVYFIGAPGIVSIKRSELEYKRVKNGQVVIKTYAGKSSVTSTIDMFTYLFEGLHMETANTAPMFIQVQMTLSVHNLHTIWYQALPAGIWIDRAEEAFVDIVRAHVANSDYGKILKERAYDESQMSAEELTQHKKHHSDLKESIYTLLLSPKARQEFIDVCGHYPVNVLIHDMGLEGSKEYKKALLEKSIAKAKGEGKVEAQRYETQIAEESVSTNTHKRTAAVELAMVEVDVQKAYNDLVLLPLEDKPVAAQAYIAKQLSNGGLQVLGGKASTLLTTQKTKKGGNE